MLGLIVRVISVVTYSAEAGVEPVIEIRDNPCAAVDCSSNIDLLWH